MPVSGTDKHDEPVPNVQSSTRRICALDLGSKTFKAIIGERRGETVATRLLAKRTLRLGTEVAGNNGIISSAKLAEVRQALLELRELCTREGGDVILAVATRAVRQAANRAAFLDTARDSGVAVEVADGVREGELAYLAVSGYTTRKLVCDFGSRSMQLAWRTGNAIEAHSLDVGYERAHTEFFLDAPSFAQARERYTQSLRKHLAAVPAGVDELICLAMNTMASFVTGLPKAEITDQPLQRVKLLAKLAEVDALSTTDAAKLRAATPKLNKILPGLVLLDCLLEQTGLETATIAQAEMAAGLIVEYFRRDGAT